MRKRKIKLLCDVITIVFDNRNDIAPASCKRDAKHPLTGMVSHRYHIEPASYRHRVNGVLMQHIILPIDRLLQAALL